MAIHPIACAAHGDVHWNESQKQFFTLKSGGRRNSRALPSPDPVLYTSLRTAANRGILVLPEPTEGLHP
jgi:hypothetical protein